MHINVKIKRNSDQSLTGEQSDFIGDDAQAQFDGWKASRPETFGPDQDFDLVVTDMTASDAAAKKVISRADVRAGCEDVIDQISAINTDSGMTDDQMDAFYANKDVQVIMLALLTGAPGKAMRALQAVGPGLGYPQAQIDQISAQLQALS